MSESYAVEEAYPVHSEEAFHRGIQYEARYIGSMDVSRPQSRAEIVAAMRRVRFEFKAKAAKKRKVVIAISLDGVSLIFKRPPKPWHEGATSGGGVGCGQLLMHHPIYRIFYVSHDSQDLKIFSYIARDSHRNAFKCNVFKAAKKVQAVRIVRTIGQAFEICHQLSLASKEQQQQQQLQRQQAEAGKSSSKVEKTEQPQAPSPQLQSESMVSVATETSPSWEELQLLLLAATTDTNNDAREGCDCQPAHWRRHSRQLMQQQLEHQAQQTQAALAEAQLLRDQLAAESAARAEAQARAQRLLGQNRDLLDHLNQLVHRTRALELRLHQQQMELQQQQPSTLRYPCGQSCVPFRGHPQQQQQHQLRLPETTVRGTAEDSFENDDNDDASPDSGHKEMSSDSLSQALSLTQEPSACQQRAATFPSVPPPPMQRRTVQTPASLDCRPHSWKPSAAAAVVSPDAEGSTAAAAVSGPAAACWSEQFDSNEPAVAAAAAAHLNHSFEWSGEAACGQRS